MAATYVKGTVITSSTGNNCSGAVSSTAGNALICGSCADVNSAPTVTGGGITTWTKDTSGSYASAQAASSISSGPNSSGGSNTLTSTATGATAGATAIVHEWSGLPSSGLLADATSPAIKTGTASTTGSTNSLTNTSANAVFIAFISDNTGANPATITSTGTGWTQPADAKNTNGSIADASGLAYKIVSSVAADSESWTIDSSSSGGLIAVYKQAVVSSIASFSPIILPNNRVGPPALRALHRSGTPFILSVAPAALPFIFRKTFSPIGTRTGSRQAKNS